MPAKVLAKGKAAADMAAKVITQMKPIKVKQASLIIRVGTIDKRDKTWYLGRAGGRVWYVRNDELRVVGIREFNMDSLVLQRAREGYRRNAHLVPFIKVVVALSVGVVAGMFAIGALIGGIVVTGIKVYTLFDAHPKEVQIIRKHLPNIMLRIKFLEITCPVLYGKLSAVVGKGVMVALSKAPSGVTGHDVAEVFGRIIGGWARAVTGEVVTVFTVLWNVVGRPLVSASLKLPSVVTRGAIVNRKAVAKAIIAEIQKQKVNISPGEAAAIRRELCIVHAALPTLDALQKELKDIEPAMNTLVKNWNKMSE